MPQLQTLILQFTNELTQNDIPKFRGAVIASLKEKNILYHNHIEDNFRYAYPLIQYKRIHQKVSEFAYFASYALNRLRSDMQYSFRSRQSLRLKRVLA